jgi:hypothetical protein
LNKEISKKIIWTIFILGNIVFLLKIKWIGGIIPSLSLLDIVAITEKTAIYADTDKNYGFSVGYIERIITFILFTLFYDKYVKLNSINRVFYNAYILYFIFFFFFAEISVFTERFSYIFMFSYWIIYPNIYAVLNTKLKKMIFLCMFTVVSLVKIVQINNNIFARYDNVLWGIESYENRKVTLKKHSKELFDY